MKRFQSLLLLLLYCFASGQFIQQQFNKKYIYTQQDRDWTYYFGNDEMPFLKTAGSDPDLSHHESIENTFIYRKKITYITGNISAKKYFADFSFTELEREYFSGGTKYELSEKLWEYDGRKDLKMVITRNSDSRTIRLFFENRNDGINYSDVANAILRTETYPEITNYDRILGKGWLMVYAEELENDGNAYEIASFKEAEIIPEFILLIPKNFLDSFVERWDALKYIMKEPYPVYCEVMAFNGGLDKAVKSSLIDFLGAMCTDYDRWGRYSLQDFQAFFMEQIDENAKTLMNRKKLATKQIGIFKKEASEYSALNQKEKLMQDN